ncbi:hypothetical protein DUNSADRAFT_17730 [Dunaliella salina]|uniref:Uncharacterized protein n=1 Tax=Dunaliella salina TaxID=3046 RepID=A0ABQ7GZU8_DUNSA|nr:hypothetical protein DUNSADRAFT_17730 [Dunaliella salina]|eukprot:KAF5840129.1 hypothetical protein DUNSADRAFT_17730 [Dunaliella salina]
MQHPPHHHASPPQQAHRAKQRLLHHGAPSSARLPLKSVGQSFESRPTSGHQSSYPSNTPPSPARPPSTAQVGSLANTALPASRPASSPLGLIHTPSRMANIPTLATTTAPAPPSRSSTPLTPTSLNAPSPLTPTSTEAHDFSQHTQHAGGEDELTSPKTPTLPKANEAMHTKASDSPFGPHDSVPRPATPCAAKRGPLPADALARPHSIHMPLPAASLPASPAGCCTADRARSPGNAGHTSLGGAGRTWDLAQLPPGSQTMSVGERGPTPHPWTPPLQAPRLHPPSPPFSFSSTGTHRSPVSISRHTPTSKSPLAGAALDMTWEGMRTHAEAPYALKESSLILSLLQSVRGAAPPNSIPHQHRPRPRTSELLNAPTSNIRSSPASLRKLATPSPNDASAANPLTTALPPNSARPIMVPPSNLGQQHQGTCATASGTPSIGRQCHDLGVGANQPTRHVPSPISADLDPVHPAASPQQHHQSLPAPPLTWPASPPLHLPPLHSPLMGVSSLEKPAGTAEPTTLSRQPLLGQGPSVIYQHPKSQRGLYDTTHLLPPLSSVDPLDLGEGCPPEVQELLMNKLRKWLPLPYKGGGAAGGGPVGISCGETSTEECQGDEDGQDVGKGEEQGAQCRGRQATTAHGPWPADHSKCAGPLCRAAQVGKGQWWAPGNDDWPFAQGGAASGADRAGLRHQLIASFTQYGCT